VIGTASVRLPAPSLSRMAETWNLTVNAPVPRVITLGLACIWSICRRAGELTSATSAAVAPAASFVQPVPVGAGVAEPAAAIVAVGTDVPTSVPSAFLPVTWIRSVLPWSDAFAVYSVPVAPAMSWHAPPLVSQTRH